MTARSTEDSRTLAQVHGGWDFDNMGPEFDAHVAKHLPGYADVQRLVALVASFVLPVDGAVFADLGASTGRTAREILTQFPQRDITCHLYDADRSMLEQAALSMREALCPQPDFDKILFHHLTLPDALRHSGAHLTVAMWLLQFLSPDRRRAVLRDSYRAAAPSGAILVASKVRMRDGRWGEIAAAALDDYKAEQGVTPAERTAKTASLRGVLQAPTTGEIANDLRAAGWSEPVVLWRWHIWAVVGAWKTDSHDLI